MEVVACLRFPEGFQTSLVANKSFKDSEVAVAQHKESLSRQFESLIPYLSSICFNSVLDIGCGLAGIDALIANTYKTKTFHLLDGSGAREKLNGFSVVTPEPWDDVSRGVRFMRDNVDDDVAIIPHHPDTLPKCGVVDLILSLRSWGHHYPIHTYLNLAKRSLSLGGHLVLDIRKGTDGYDQLISNGFRYARQIPDTSEKCTRLAFVRV